MADVKTPCESCIHNKVCGARTCFEETEVKTTHPYVKVILECTEFYAKPQQRSKELENPFNDSRFGGFGGLQTSDLIEKAGRSDRE